MEHVDAMLRGESRDRSGQAGSESWTPPEGDDGYTEARRFICPGAWFIQAADGRLDGVGLQPSHNLDDQSLSATRRKAEHNVHDAEEVRLRGNA